MIPDLYNAPASPQDFETFAFANADHHVQVATAIQARSGLQLSQYPLDPIPTGDFPGWARRHQTAHNDVNQVLGVAGVDLTDLQVEDKNRLEAWIQLHAGEHVQWANILGVF